MDSIVKFGVMRFKDFLSESFIPRQTYFGFDFQNKRWKELDDNFFVTFFEFAGNQYVVIYRKGHIGFGSGWKVLSVDDVDKIKTFNEVIYLFQLSKKNNYRLLPALSIFNRVFYVMLEGIKHFNPDKIFFSGFNTTMEEFYEKMMKDKSMLKIIEDSGYMYNGFIEDFDSNQSGKVHTFLKNNFQL